MPWKIARSVPRLLLALLTLALSTAVGACDGDGTGPGPLPEALGVVLNSVEVSVTVFGVDDPGSTTTVGLAPEGSPVSMAVSGRLAVVPLGFVPAVAVVDLDEGTVTHTVALPEGSGATGVAFVNDSVALVANPGLGTVSPVNVRSGSAATGIAVGTYPQAVVRVGTNVAVLNAELGPDFLPTGPSTVTVLDGATLARLGEVTLSGENAGSAAVGPDGRLYVVNSGRFGAADGSLSVVDVSALAEVEHHPGFGDFPFGAAFGPGGRLHVGSFAYGIAVWDPATDAFVRPPEDAVAPGGVPSVSGLGFDGEGRLYALEPECSDPGVVHRLGPSFQVELDIPVGICPIAIGFTSGG